MVPVSIYEDWMQEYKLPPVEFYPDQVLMPKKQHAKEQSRSLLARLI